MRPVAPSRWDRSSILLIALLVLGACESPSGSTPTVAPTTTTAVTQGTEEPTTTTQTTSLAGSDEAPCSSGSQPFVENGGAGLIERDDSDADIVSGVRWADHGSCVRVVVEFTASSGAPAVSPPGVGPLFIRSAGVLRLQLESAVSRSAILEQIIDTDLVAMAYVVRRPTGDMFVDLHLDDPAVVRVSVASGPARVVVDVMAGGDPYVAPAVVTDDLVVIDPVGGTAIYPFTVNGYTRGEADQVTVTIEAGGAGEIYDGEVGERSDAWGAFTVLVPDGPDGSGSMIVGDRIPISVDLS